MINQNQSRRSFLGAAGTLAIGAMAFPDLLTAENRKAKKIGLQLYTVRKEMLEDAAGTLKQVATIGYKEIESAKSQKGNYYGLSPQEIKSMTGDLGISLISGHVQIDADWQKSIDQAAEAGQTYLYYLPGGRPLKITSAAPIYLINPLCSAKKRD
jgi:hypothetical protein